jgi:MOSC domain-containing protein YiiM
MMEELSEVQAVADAGFEGCAHARRGMLCRVIGGGTIRCSDTIEKHG